MANIVVVGAGVVGQATGKGLQKKGAGMVMSRMQQQAISSLAPEDRSWTRLERCNFFIFFPAGCN